MNPRWPHREQLKHTRPLGYGGTALTGFTTGILRFLTGLESLREQKMMCMKYRQQLVMTPRFLIWTAQ